MDNNIVISIDGVPDQVLIDNKYRFTANITIGLTSKTDFYIKLEFKNLTQDDFETVAKLSGEIRAIPITSDVIEKESFNITHVVIERFQAKSNLEYTWECLSDEPFSLEL